MYLPRNLLASLRFARNAPPAGPLQESLSRRRSSPQVSLLESLGSVHRIRWRAISRLRRAARVGKGGAAWIS